MALEAPCAPTWSVLDFPLSARPAPRRGSLLSQRTAVPDWTTTPSTGVQAAVRSPTLALHAVSLPRLRLRGRGPARRSLARTLLQAPSRFGAYSATRPHRGSTGPVGTATGQHRHKGAPPTGKTAGRQPTSPGPRHHPRSAALPRRRDRPPSCCGLQRRARCHRCPRRGRACGAEEDCAPC